MPSKPENLHVSDLSWVMEITLCFYTSIPQIKQPRQSMEAGEVWQEPYNDIFLAHVQGVQFMELCCSGYRFSSCCNLLMTGSCNGAIRRMFILLRGADHTIICTMEILPYCFAKACQGLRQNKELENVNGCPNDRLSGYYVRWFTLIVHVSLGRNYEGNSSYHHRFQMSTKAHGKSVTISDMCFCLQKMWWW